MEKETTGAILKALDILEIFLKDQDEVGISEMANLAGLKVSTVHRIASTLVNRGYLKQQGKRGKYVLGLKFLRYNNVLKKTLKIRDIALPFLENLRKISGESANLAICDQNEVVYIEHIESNQTLRAFTEIGNRVPLYCTGVGKLFLAHLGEEELNKMANLPRKRITENTITDFNKLKAELAVIKRESVAVDNGEMDIGLRCLAAPVKDLNGKAVAAISISGPFTRLTNKRIKELKPLVKRVGWEISRAIGYEGE